MNRNFVGNLFALSTHSMSGHLKSFFFPVSDPRIPAFYNL